MSTTLEDLEGWVDTMMRKRDIYKYNLDVSGSTSKGDGYLGEVNFIKVVADLNDGKEKTYNLVVKSAKKSDEFRKQTPIQEAYQREMFMYMKVFPVFEEFQKESSIQDPFDKYAKCYSVCHENKKEALIFKNLKSQGFEIHDRTVPQNLNHALYVFRCYGKFHGVSMAMRIKKPALFKSLTKNMDDLLVEFISKTKMIDTFINDFRKGVDGLRENGKEHLAKKYDGMENEVRKMLTNPSLPSEAHRVILHGDCWNNNMMFKYEGNNQDTPTDIRFVDFQMSRSCHPIHDLSYYLYSSCDKEALANFDNLLREYHSGLSQCLAGFGIGTDEFLTFEELKEHWRTYGLLGLAVCGALMKLMFSESDEIIDLEDGCRVGFNELFSMGLKNEDIRMRRIIASFQHYAETCL